MGFLTGNAIMRMQFGDLHAAEHRHQLMCKYHASVYVRPWCSWRLLNIQFFCKQSCFCVDIATKWLHALWKRPSMICTKVVSECVHCEAGVLTLWHMLC